MDSVVAAREAVRILHKLMAGEYDLDSVPRLPLIVEPIADIEDWEEFLQDLYLLFDAAKYNARYRPWATNFFNLLSLNVLTKGAAEAYLKTFVPEMYEDISRIMEARGRSGGEEPRGAPYTEYLRAILPLWPTSVDPKHFIANWLPPRARPWAGVDTDAILSCPMVMVANAGHPEVLHALVTHEDYGDAGYELPFLYRYVHGKCPKGAHSDRCDAIRPAMQRVVWVNRGDRAFDPAEFLYEDEQ